MPDFLAMVERGPKRRSKTRAQGSHTEEQRQPQALWCWLQCSPGRMLQPPPLLPPPSPAVNTDRTHTGPQPWISHAGAVLGSGRRKRICSVFPALPLSPLCPDFFLLWEQGTACITDNKGSDRHCWSMGRTVYTPRILTTIILGEPPKCSELVLSSNQWHICQMLPEV